MASRQDAIDVVRSRTGLAAGAAGTLVDAFLAAVRQEALDLIAGDQPVPSALNDVRALRLRYLAEELNRPPTQREVGVLFRLTRSGAAAVISRMNATYATLSEGLLRVSVLAVLSDPQNVKLEGSANAGWRYIVAFDERAQVDYVAAVLERNGRGRAVVRTTSRAIEVEQKIGNQDTIDLLKQWLA